MSVDSEGLLHREGAVVAPGCFASDGLRTNERGLTLVIDDPAHGDLPIGIEFSRFQKRCKKTAFRRAERWKPWKAGPSEPF